MTTPLTIRIARPQDARALAAIYRPYVEQTAISFECEAPTATAMLRRMENVLTRYPYLVAERGGDLLGYAYAHPFIGRAAYDWSAEMTIYLRMDARRAPRAAPTTPCPGAAEPDRRTPGGDRAGGPVARWGALDRPA